MKATIFKTNNDIAPTILRVVLGVVIAAHGAQKLLGWFEGFGFISSMNYFTGTMGFPYILGLFIITLESIGAIALIVGFGTRLLSLAFLFLALGILSIHIPNGFFMNWFNNHAGEGYEYFLLWIAMASTLIITGGGRFSVDRYIQK